jgi:hypothetical protein
MSLGIFVWTLGRCKAGAKIGLPQDLFERIHFELTGLSADTASGSDPVPGTKNY